MILAIASFCAPTAEAQVFDPGPSGSSLFTNGVFNVPADDAPTSVGELQQLNLFEGGSIRQFYFTYSGSEFNVYGGYVGRSFYAESGSEVNIMGGSVGWDSNANSGSIVNISGGSVENSFRADSGSEVNISGGSVGDFFEAESGSEVNISGGDVADRFFANSGSEVNISGGNFGISFNAMSGSAVNISGGSFGIGFNARPGSDVELIGGEFQLNGSDFTEATVTVSTDDVFTGTFQDGSTFIFSFDRLSNVTLTNVTLPVFDMDPIVVNTALPNRPSGLRAGQTLALQDGGELNDNFEAIGGTINVEGGSFGDYGGVYSAIINISGGTIGDWFGANTGSEVNISGGDVGDRFIANSGSIVNITGGNVGGGFDAHAGSEVNISGGNVGNYLEALSDSEVNLFGTEFLVNGILLTELAVGEAFTITERDLLLSGTLADGSAFEFEILSTRPSTDWFVDQDATLNLHLMPEDFLAGDYNADGIVDGSDYTIWRDSLGQDGTAIANNIHTGVVTNAAYETWAANYGATLPTEVLLAGDFNNDGSVDAADYTVWRDGLGTSYIQADYDVWRDNYGATISASSNAIPEPSAAVLLMFGFTLCLFSHRHDL